MTRRCRPSSPARSAAEKTWKCGHGWQGILQSQNYDEGTLVRKGQLLFVIDPKPFEATVARVQADMAQAQALHNRAEIQVNRLRPLVADNAVSQQDLDNAVASEEASRPAMAAAQAQLTSAELDLGYTRVTSPITGLAGNRQVDVGSYVGSPQPTVLTVVSSLDPVRFDFTISEAEYLTYARATRRRAGKRSGAGAGARAGARRRIGALAEGPGHGSRTGSRCRDRHAAAPGHVRRIPGGSSGRDSSAGCGFRVTTRKEAIVIPQRAVQELQGTYNVFVVGSDSVVKIRAIKPANRSRQRLGHRPRAWSPPTGSWSRGCRRCVTGSKVRPTAAKAPAPDSTAGA